MILYYNDIEPDESNFDYNSLKEKLLYEYKTGEWKEDYENDYDNNSNQESINEEDEEEVSGEWD